MKKIIGFIGSGNMGQAMVGGILKMGLASPENIIVSDINEEKLAMLKQESGVQVTTDSAVLTREADIIFLAVKPNIYEIVMNGIKDSLTDNKIVISIAAGKSIADVETVLGSDKKIVRIMPNTPALVNEGMTAICPNKNIKAEELAEVKTIIDSFGKSEVVGEYLINAVTGISGSSPAYVFMFIEAMADAAVLGGMPRDMAYKFSAQAVLGSAKMVLETGKHPGELKDAVCSPGGTTIEAVATLEAEGFRSAVIKAVMGCINKAKVMSEKK